MVSLVRLVSRPLLADPVAALPSTVRKWGPTRRSSSEVLAPLDFKYAKQEVRVAEFIIGIVDNVLGHVAVQELKSGRVRQVPPSANWRLASIRVNFRCEITSMRDPCR